MSHRHNDNVAATYWCLYSSTLSRVLSPLKPVVKPPELHPWTSARVMTSTENRKIIDQKEKDKEEKWH